MAEYRRKRTPTILKPCIPVQVEWFLPANVIRNMAGVHQADMDLTSARCSVYLTFRTQRQSCGYPSLIILITISSSLSSPKHLDWIQSGNIHGEK